MTGAYDTLTHERRLCLFLFRSLSGDCVPVFVSAAWRVGRLVGAVRHTPLVYCARSATVGSQSPCQACIARIERDATARSRSRPRPPSNLPRLDYMF